MKDPIQELAQRPQRYWYTDGLTEIAIGVTLLLLGLTFLPKGLLPPTINAQWFFGAGRILITLVAMILTNYGVRLVKEHLTYPRTGYVSYRNDQGLLRWTRRGFVISVAFSIGVVFALISRLEHINGWLPMLASLVIAVAMLSTAHRVGLARFYVLATYTLVLGGAISLLVIDDGVQPLVFFTLFSLGWLVSGTLTLIQYLQRTRPTSEQME
ncbi:MAG: hypothetical protein M1281_01820 [Chloroflexi bacterium]|nr:hypothetical protein [Chloroflexota bacterium]